jgi:hypothetical protein
VSPELLFPTIIESKALFGNGTLVTSCRATVTWSGGALRFYLGLSSDIDTSPTNWEEVVGLQSGVEMLFSFSTSGVWVFYKIIKDPDTIITSTLDGFGRNTFPAIRVRAFTEVDL